MPPWLADTSSMNSAYATDAHVSEHVYAWLVKILYHLESKRLEPSVQDFPDYWRDPVGMVMVCQTKFRI